MLRIREVEEKDFYPLAEFLPNGFPYTTKELWLPLFELWWSSNPAYTDQFPRGWVLENDASIVGFIGNIPVKFVIRGEVRIAFAANSWYVDPSFRGILSLRLLEKFINQKSASLFLFKKDNESLIKILNKYKFEEFILPSSEKEYAFIINKKKIGFFFLNFLLSHNRLPQLSELLEYYKRIGFLFFGYLYQKPVIRGGVLPIEEYTSSLCRTCDDSFSRLWEPYLHSCDVILSHDTKTLNWLYFSSARTFKRVVIQCHRSSDKTLVGYMVYEIQRSKPEDEGCMQLVDICIENKDPQILASLTSFAFEIGKQNNAPLLVVWANSQETETYFRRTFIMRRNIQHHRYIRFPDTDEKNSGKDNHYKVCLPMIFPPQ